MNKKLTKKLPSFKDGDAERAYWDSLDVSKVFSKKDFVEVAFPNVKPSTSFISHIGNI